MKLHYFDDTTGEYNGSRAPEQFLADGQPSKPRNATLVAPPKTKAGFARVWQGGSWQQVEDNRGETLYDIKTGEPVTITALGSVPDDLTDAVPEPGQVWSEAAKDWMVDPAYLATQQRETILAELASLDTYIPRGLEDTWDALEASGSLDTTKLPQVQQNRLARKHALRTELAEFSKQGG